MTCSGCGKSVEAMNYCSFCGTGLDEESQREVEREYEAIGEKRRLINACEELEEFAGGELFHLERIKRRIEQKDVSYFMEEDS